MKFSQIERGDQQFFCCFQRGIKNLTESFIPFLPPPPPRELKNDNSLKQNRINWFQAEIERKREFSLKGDKITPFYFAPNRKGGKKSIIKIHKNM